MKYETKFSLGDFVWGVSDQEFYRIVRCAVCKNTGKLEIGGESLICPKCNGQSTHRQYAGRKFYISMFRARVGQVRIEDTEDGHYRREDEPNPKFEYMADSTGIGSGQIWKQDRLFESEADAQNFCATKNGVLLPDEPEGKQILGMYGDVIAEAAQ